MNIDCIYNNIKLQERYPPYLDDLVFVCDEAYSREQFLETEMKLITALNFDINLPVSYLFLRRYAKAMKFTMPQVRIFIINISTNFNYSAYIGTIRSRIESDGIPICFNSCIQNGVSGLPLVTTSL